MEQSNSHEKLELLRKPFEAHQISKLPKPTKAQTDEVRNNFQAGIRCTICGQWHHPKVVHLDYVGHAALTDRLLDVDPAWSWDPLALDEKGLPAIDRDGGMWIKLTVCGVTRLGYGDAQGKTGGDAMKERIGDALRNAAMRFGAALDLWHKGVLHMDADTEPDVQASPTKAPARAPAKHAKPAPTPAPSLPDESVDDVILAMVESMTLPELQKVFGDAYKKASAPQQVKLKAAYDEIKTNLINAGEHA
jgi:hypothetical protein